MLLPNSLAFQTIMRNSLKIGFIILLLGLIALQLIVMKSLHYTTSSVSWYSIEEAENEEKPSPNFAVGNLKFDVEEYSKAKELEPFRIYYRENCDGKKGIKAASCLSENLLEKVPFGEPSDELFFPGYSPVKSFEEHLDGKAGHCVSFSGMTADSLLSVGIPARLVQLLPSEKKVNGHNVIEVWDEKEGWVLFDPLSDNLLANENGQYLSALEAIASKSKIKPIEAGTENITEGHLVDYYDGDTPFDKAITFPEPWLYTRVGEKESSIFRGSFVAFGEGYFEYGGVQTWLRYSVLLCILLLLIASISLIKGLYSKLLK